MAPQGEAVAGSVVVRVAVDGAGRVAAPVVVWRGSGVAAADDLACEVVAGLRFVRNDRGEGSEVVEPVGAGWVWGRIRLDWGWALAVEPVVEGGGA
jgi:TonB family protein